MICHDCPLGKEERHVGDGINEPPYVFLVRCPFETEYYKNWDDACNHENERNAQLKGVEEETLDSIIQSATKTIHGSDLKLALVRRNRKPSELAEYLGVSRAAISHWFKGQPIPLKHYDRIAFFLGENSPLEEALTDISTTDARSLYEIIISMTRDQKISVIQFILGTL